jgi:hypothetical protein
MRKPTTDHHPGPPPEIRAVPQGVVFEFDETGGEQGARLVIRCDNNGNVYASIPLRNSGSAFGAIGVSTGVERFWFVLAPSNARNC